MAAFWKSIIITIFVLCSLLDYCVSAEKCQSGTFKKHGKCEPCSKCPINQIVRKPCQHHHDTECSPFYEFNDIADKMSNNHDNVEIKSTAIPAKQSSIMNVVKDTNADDHYWKMLSFGLIGALVFVTIVCTIYIVILQLRVKRLEHKHLQEVHIDESYLPYIQSRLFSRDRLSTNEYQTSIDQQVETSQINEKSKYKKLRQIFRPKHDNNEQADDVFINDPASSSNLRNNRLSMIPEGLQKEWFRNVPPLLNPMENDEDTPHICVNPLDS